MQYPNRGETFQAPVGKEQSRGCPENYPLIPHSSFIESVEGLTKSSIKNH